MAIGTIKQKLFKVLERLDTVEDLFLKATRDPVMSKDPEFKKLINMAKRKIEDAGDAMIDCQDYLDK